MKVLQPDSATTSGCSSGVRRHLHLARFKWLARAVAKHSTSYKSVLELGCFDGKAIDFLPASAVRYSGFDASEGAWGRDSTHWRTGTWGNRWSTRAPPSPPCDGYCRRD